MFLLQNPLITPDIGLAFWTVFIFIILLILLRKLAWGPIVTGLKNREQSIDEALSEARKAREEMKNLQSKNEQIVREAKAERDQIIKEAREMKEQIIAEAKASAGEEGRKILIKAREDIQREKETAFNEVKKEIAVLAIEAASKILKKELANQPEQQQLIEAYLEDAKLN